MTSGIKAVLSCKSATYKSWSMMKVRCNCPTNKLWSYYGGRGIRVCERWEKSFNNFVVDMGERPSGSTLDRIDNAAGYSPENCRWATKSEQARNRRSNVFITFNCETLLIDDWAVKLGVKPNTLKNRLWRGWSVEKTLTVAVQKWNRS